MREIQVRIHGTILTQPEVFVRWRKALQKVDGNQLVKFRETGFEEWVLVPRDDCRLSEITTDVVVRHSTKQHGSLDEQQKRVGVPRGVIHEYVLLGNILWISRDASLRQSGVRFERQKTPIARPITTPVIRSLSQSTEVRCQYPVHLSKRLSTNLHPARTTGN